MCIRDRFKLSFHHSKTADRSDPDRISRWRRTPDTELHPLYQIRWDLLVVDEACSPPPNPYAHATPSGSTSLPKLRRHLMRNPATDWTAAHLQLALGTHVPGLGLVGGCRKRLALTASPVFNHASDMVGLCMSVGTDLRFRQRKSWRLRDKSTTVDPKTARAFRQFTDRVRDDILDLPPLTHTIVSFSAQLGPQDASWYNRRLLEAQTLRRELDGERASALELQRLMGILQKLQQCLVSPQLARLGAKEFKENQTRFAEAAAVETGALRALHRRIRSRQAEGYNRVLVACEHVSLLEVARLYLLRHEAAGQGVGHIYTFDGRSPLSRRQSEKRDFLTGELTVMLLSISAGGTGLHLAPGCRLAIFWGSRPFSPLQVHQTSKRIHRIGQDQPVQVDHLIARGSVDASIQKMHADKLGLANAIVDQDWSHFESGSLDWRRSGRLVDSCLSLDETGNFPAPKGRKRARPASVGATSLPPL